VKWEGQIKFGDYQEANVKYLYKIDNLADWTKKPEFLAAFPYVGKIVEAAGTKEQQGGVKLTSLGWVPDNYLQLDLPSVFRLPTGGFQATCFSLC
jgi:hypothetical protein